MLPNGTVAKRRAGSSPTSAGRARRSRRHQGGQRRAMSIRAARAGSTSSMQGQEARPHRPRRGRDDQCGLRRRRLEDALFHHAQHALLGQPEDRGHAGAGEEENRVNAATNPDPPPPTGGWTPKRDSAFGWGGFSGKDDGGHRVHQIGTYSSRSGRAGRSLIAVARPDNWVAAWGASQQSLGETKLSNATARMIARVTLPGSSVRIRLDNTFGKEPLVIGRATIGAARARAFVAAGLVKPVTFKGQASVTIPAGGSAESDAIALSVDAQQDLASVSMSPAPTFSRASIPTRSSPRISPRTARAIRPLRRRQGVHQRPRPRCSG